MTTATLEATLSALAEPARRRVLERLGSGPTSAGALAGEVGLTPPAMSRHLRVLLESGLVEDARDPRDARRRVFRLRREPLEELGGWLASLERAWTAQMQSFKAHVERKARRRT